jgi:hypothetical protein
MTPTEGQGDEEGVSLDARSVHSDFHSVFFTILDSILTAG